MPSVRVRRSDNYLRLRDRLQDPEDSLRVPGTQTERYSERPRSRTIAHIFGEYPTQQQQQQQHGATASVPSQAASSSNEGFVVSNAPQVELLIPAHRQPGLIGSALDLSEVVNTPSDDSPHHEDALVEHLEAIDPQIAAVSNLSNAANSILIPPINIFSRKPIITLPRRQDVDILVDTETGRSDAGSQHRDEVDEHVDDVISKKAVVRRTLQGVLSFLKTPQGVITALYGFLCAFWGAAIVLFLGKLINLHNANTQGFWVEVSSQIENGLFTATGVGFIPWRIIDTYRVLKIWHFKRLTRKLRRNANLPPLVDEDDLPDPTYDPNYVHVLTDDQQLELQYRPCLSLINPITAFTDMAIILEQAQFQKSQTWYRPHGTSTHKAFPINTALLICLLIDGNSVFQCMLCGCMWGLNRFERPAWTTGTLIPASFLCGMAAAVFIWKGGQKTRRTKDVQDRLKAALLFEKHTGVPAGLSISTADHAVLKKSQTEPIPQRNEEKDDDSPEDDEKQNISSPTDI